MAGKRCLQQRDRLHLERRFSELSQRARAWGFLTTAAPKAESARFRSLKVLAPCRQRRSFPVVHEQLKSRKLPELQWRVYPCCQRAALGGGPRARSRRARSRCGARRVCFRRGARQARILLLQQRSHRTPSSFSSWTPRASRLRGQEQKLAQGARLACASRARTASRGRSFQQRYGTIGDKEKRIYDYKIKPPAAPIAHRKIVSKPFSAHLPAGRPLHDTLVGRAVGKRLEMKVEFHLLNWCSRLDGKGGSPGGPSSRRRAA